MQSRFHGSRGLGHGVEKEIGRTGSIQYTSNAGWSSLVARWAHNPKVAGSNPAPATNLPVLNPTSYPEDAKMWFAAL